MMSYMKGSKTSPTKLLLQTVSTQKRKNVEGMPIETTALCNDRRKARLAMLTDPSTKNKDTYRKLNREEKNAVRCIKNLSLEKKISQLEEHFQINESHHLFKSVRELEGKPKKSLFAVKILTVKNSSTEIEF